MFRGAIYAARVECRSNMDWISQAANSLREILYPFWKRKDDALKMYGSAADTPDIQELSRVYGKLTALAHHGSDSRTIDFPIFTLSDFEKLTADF